MPSQTCFYHSITKYQVAGDCNKGKITVITEYIDSINKGSDGGFDDDEVHLPILAAQTFRTWKRLSEQRLAKRGRKKFSVTSGPKNEAILNKLTKEYLPTSAEVYRTYRFSSKGIQIFK